MNQTYVMYKWKGNDMNFHGDYAVSYVEHQDHLSRSVEATLWSCSNPTQI